MTGPFDFLHIKGRTAGSSNELSFDVLDAKRSGIEARAKAKANRSSKSPAAAPSPKQGSYHGVAGSSTLSAVPEVERRKRARRVRTARLWVVSVVAIAALIGTAGYFGYRFYQEKIDFSGHFNTLIDRFIEIDKTLVEIDDLMDNPMNGANLEGQSSVSEKSPQIVHELNALKAESQEMMDAAQNDDDLAALSSMQLASEARRNMISTAIQAFDLSRRANELAAAAASEWDKVLEADSLARAATEAANSASTEDATRAAQSQTASALELLRTARDGLAGIDQQDQGAGLSAEVAYVDKRVEALEAAMETADALLDADRSTATSANNAYNAADREAVKLASDLPASPSDQVLASFQSDMDAAAQRYDEARSAAATADSAIRAYL